MNEIRKYKDYNSIYGRKIWNEVYLRILNKMSI